MGGRQDEPTGDVSASARVAIGSALHRDLRGIDFEKFGFAESESSRFATLTLAPYIVART